MYKQAMNLVILILNELLSCGKWFLIKLYRRSTIMFFRNQYHVNLWVYKNHTNQRNLWNMLVSDHARNHRGTYRKRTIAINHRPVVILPTACDIVEFTMDRLFWGHVVRFVSTFLPFLASTFVLYFDALDTLKQRQYFNCFLVIRQEGKNIYDY